MAAVALAVGLCLGAVAPAVAAAHQGPTEGLDVAVAPDGSATVTLVSTYELTDANESDAFERLRNDDQARERLQTRFRDRMARVAADAANATGREMSVTGAAVDLRTVEDTGVVELSVTWEGLAAADGERLTVTEPFASGFQSDRPVRLTVPEGYGVTSATPDPTERDGRTLVWAAGTSLDGFAVSLEEAATRSDGGDGGSSSGSGPGFGAVLALVAVAALAGVTAHRR